MPGDKVKKETGERRLLRMTRLRPAGPRLLRAAVLAEGGGSRPSDGGGTSGPSDGGNSGSIRPGETATQKAYSDPYATVDVYITGYRK